MNIRRLLPRSLRWKMAVHYVNRAELCTSRAKDADLTGDHALADRWHRLSLQTEVVALLWWPVEHAGMVPMPGEELLDGDGNDPLPGAVADREYSCVICGEPVRARMRNETTGGLYCDLCWGYDPR